MNYKMMAYILGNIMQAEGLLMSISAASCVIQRGNKRITGFSDYHYTAFGHWDSHEAFCTKE